jgi:hypothetical protein
MVLSFCCALVDGEWWLLSFWRLSTAFAHFGFESTRATDTRPKSANAKNARSPSKVSHESIESSPVNRQW